MKRILFIALFFIGSSMGYAAEATESTKAVRALLDRIGGKGTSERIAISVVADRVAEPVGAVETVEATEGFLISQKDGKPAIEGTSLSALTAGIGWYLNHYAHVNLSWNCLTADLSNTPFPLPEQPERHLCNAPYRYYLNYCTFGYSMSVWSWERWQQEIDWMALHGVNMPLQIVGLEAVWREFLMHDLGKEHNYSEEEAEEFIPGPAFTGWWGMNNLEGWGGDGEDASKGVHNNAWYQRQAQLAKKIVKRERELGIEPVLPGFSGMVPNNFHERTGYATEQANGWCHFQRPTIIDPTSEDFAYLAARYYKRLEKVMGRSRYYSMDPFHEGGTIASRRYAEGYAAIYKAMNAYAGEQSQWVIQQWHWAPYQETSLKAVPAGRLIVLELLGDDMQRFDRYQGYAPQHAVYCIIPNFGGRTGFFGRIPKVAKTYFTFKAKYPTVMGVGAVPEAIEQTPVVYDFLYELPWMDKEPDTQKWMEEYATARYGRKDAAAVKAWELLRQTALNDTSHLQGPHEAVVCARPALTVDRVSTWGGTEIFYLQNIDKFHEANKALYAVKPTGYVGKENLRYDLCDITRQAMTDDAQHLLQEVREAWEQQDTVAFKQKSDAFLQLILDLDTLLGTHPLFRLDRWTQMARDIAKELKESKKKRKESADWLEYNNARTLITTWGGEGPSEGAGLHDYSYREWHGMLRDYYYPRWQYFFSHGCTSPASWFPHDWNWAHPQ